MEKRIRIVWMLSLVSAFLLVGVQGYWLYNQYRYVIDLYSEKLAEEILRAGSQEFELRKKRVTTDLTYVVKRNTELAHNLGGKVVEQRDAQLFFMLTDSTDTILRGNSHLNLTFDTNMSEDSLYAAIDRSLVNRGIPFRKEMLDSVLTSILPDVSFSTVLLTRKDTSVLANSWKKGGSLFAPEVICVYAYSPLENQGVSIRVYVPTPIVIRQMGMQLVLSLGLIGLLLVCLVFQIKTILKQKKLNELRQSFVNTMIHELKRPVQTLKMFISFLSDREMRRDLATTDQVIQDSKFELDNLSAYLTKLKDMVLADGEETPLHPVLFDFKEMMEKIVRLNHAPVPKKVEFALTFEMDTPWVKADPVHLANVLNNLIENAVKYSGPQVEIRIETVRRGQGVWITVRDNGLGIPVIEQDRVFRKFYRGAQVPEREIPGMGLGLSYVKLITDAHRGTISLESCPGKGTSITLYLPQ